MSENTQNQQNKENTIDILVTPKKQMEAKEVSAPQSTTPTPSAPKTPGENPGGKKAVARRTVAKAAAQTRKVSLPADKAAKEGAKTALAKAGAVGAAKLSTGLKGAGEAVKKAYASLNKKKGPEKKAKAKSQGKRAPLTPEEKKNIRASMGYTVTIALIYIACVVGISAILSFFGIRWANDIFAFVKEEVVATVTIPEDATVSEVSDILKENKLIEYPAIFRIYVGYRNRDADPPLAFKAGEYEISSTLNYDQIVAKIKDRKTRSIVTLTIPEGYTVDEIIDLFLSNGMGTKDGFVEAINNFDYTYTFMEKLNAIELSKDRKYRLEGYLYPDTYEFYTDSSEVAIIDKLLAAFDSHFEEEYYQRLDEMGMNLDEVITLASIVQKEGKFASDFYPVAGVFYNRLNSANYRRLQSDATIQYCLKERKEELTFEDLEVESPYNTYKNAGLPPSAISNPGWEAIQATLYPESHRHYFFISDTDGSMIFADTEAQHLANSAKLKEAKEKGTSID